MPTVDASRSLLAAGANYNAGDWASVGAETSLEFLATADLNRGVDIGLGVEALARLDGAIRQYIAADVNGQAHAAARVRAQVQMPLDLFDEAGIAVRLQAVAEAAAGVQLGIGLNIGDFLALAATDPRMRGVPIELLKIFLDEFTIQGGVMAKAAAAAMAYANLVATGSFVKRGSRLPGFTIAAEAGVGLKAGAGFRVFARFGVDDPRRLVRRTIDVAVDETLAAISQALPVDARPLAAEAAAPLKIGLRSAFELGTALVESGGSFSRTDGGKFALRLAQVGLEEMQRLVLERVVEFASLQLREALRDLNFDNARWIAALPQRQAFANRLDACPPEPFEATDANRDYWAGLIADSVNLAGALGGGATVPPFVAEPLALVWCASQLLMKSVERISIAEARASVIGAPAVGTTAAFDGALPDAPPNVRTHINAALVRGATDAIMQADAVNYLLQVITHRIDDISPPAANVLTLLTGKGAAGEALSVVFSNLGAFVPGPDGQMQAEASLNVLRNGLRTYVNARLDAELLPAIEAATAGSPEVRIYLDEVLLSTLRTVVDTVFDTVLAWQSGSADTQRALRELCSSLLMRLFGRSLVVTSDVLLAHALGRVQTELRQLATSVNDTGGVAPTIADLTGLDRELVADLLEETLEVCAETFGPMPDDRRARLRDLLYQMIDTTPLNADASTLESLKAAGMVGNAEAALELAQLLGEEIAGNLIRFVQALLTRIASTLLALLADAIADVQRAVEAWMEDIENLALELIGDLAELLQEINRLQGLLDDAVDDLLLHASRLLGGFVEFSGSRSAIRNKIKQAVSERALDALADFPGYGALPSDIRSGVRRTVRNIVDDLLDDDIFDPVVDVLRAVSTETAELLEDLREIEPGDDLVQAIAEIALDRIEDAVRAQFDGDPSVRIAFDAPILGEVSLGRIRVPIGTFVSVVRGAINALGRFDDAVLAAAGTLASMFDIETDLNAAEAEHAAATALKDEADQRIDEMRDGSLDLVILEPQPASAITGRVTVRLRIPGGNESMLASQGLSHQRLFVWVNEQTLPLAGARVRFEAPLAAVSIPGVSERVSVTGLAPRGTEPRGRGGHPLTQARAARHDGYRREGLHRSTPGSRPGAGAAAASTFRRPVGAGTANRFAGATLPPVPGGFAFPPRVPARPGVASPTSQLRPALLVDIDVPSSLLHEGLNAVACTLAPGAAQRRIERAVSFLSSAAPPVPAGRPTMPPMLVGVQLPGNVAAILNARGVAGFQAPPRVQRRPPVRGNTWVAPKRDRKKAVAASHAVLKEELAEAATRRSEARAAIKNRALRPRRTALPDKGDLL